MCEVNEPWALRSSSPRTVSEGQWGGRLERWLGRGAGAHCIGTRGPKIIQSVILNININLEYFGWNTHFLCLTCSDMLLHSSVSVLKYKKNDEDESLKDKLSKLNIHSISKKSKRVTNHLKILTRGESQVIFLLGPHIFSWGTRMLTFLWDFVLSLSELFLEHTENRSNCPRCCSFLPLSSLSPPPFCRILSGGCSDTVLAVVLPFRKRTKER